MEAVAQMLAEWDIAQTETLLKKLERAKEMRAEEEKKRKEAETLKYVFTLPAFILKPLYIIVLNGPSLSLLTKVCSFSFHVFIFLLQT